jgi:hypothetical protein
MGEFQKGRLPDPVSYFEANDVPLTGAGKWRTGPCRFHGGSDSLRVNVESGGWCCMACRVKGGDILAYAMQMDGTDFVSAARALGAYVEDGYRHRGSTEPATISARDAIELAAFELQVAMMVIADIIRGIIPSPDDWQRFILVASRIEWLAQEFRS